MFESKKLILLNDKKGRDLIEKLIEFEALMIWISRVSGSRLNRHRNHRSRLNHRHRHHNHRNHRNHLIFFEIFIYYIKEYFKKNDFYKNDKRVLVLTDSVLRSNLLLLIKLLLSIRSRHLLLLFLCLLTIQFSFRLMWNLTLSLW